MKKIDCWLCGLMLLVISNSAFAEVFCVETAEELQAALTTASSNGHDDEVRIVQGTYFSNFVYDSNEKNSLFLLGGYFAGCSNRDNNYPNTIIDGSSSGTGLYLTALDQPSYFYIEGLTIQNASTNMNSNGGGVYANNKGSITLSGNHIVNNKAESWYDSSGGGVYLEGDIATMVNNRIEGNAAHYEGGGVYIKARTANVNNNLIDENFALLSLAGGIYVNSDATTIERNDIRGNKSMGSAGGIYIEGSAMVRHNSIQSNSAEFVGGGLYILGGRSEIINNIISGNSSSNAPIGIYHGGGVHQDGGFGIFVNNTIFGNSADNGGGITLSGNGEFELYNNIIASNGKVNLYIKNKNSSVDVIAYNNNLTYGADYYVSIDSSNINVDPLFINSQNNNFRLKEDSLMIDAGYVQTPDLPEYDYGGNPRIIGGRVDIGAYEFNYSTVLNAAVLPYARAVQVNETATAFGSVINSGTSTATDCAISLPDGISAEFTYQTTNANNVLVGSPNTPVDIPAGGTQSFVFGITPFSPLNSSEIGLVFDCANSYPAITYIGLNTLILTASSDAPPDLVAIGATPSNDGVVRLEGPNGAGFFATAAVNIGSNGTVTASADDGGKELPVTLQLCETDNAGNWISCGNNLSRSVAADQTVYYTVFVTGTGQPISFDPANKRLFLRFSANGQTVGATNVAVTTD